jgi:hypothetical protein
MNFLFSDQNGLIDRKPRVTLAAYKQNRNNQAYPNTFFIHSAICKVSLSIFNLASPPPHLYRFLQRDLDDLCRAIGQPPAII